MPKFKTLTLRDDQSECSLLLGDAYGVLRDEIEDSTVDLIYIDPPFFSQSDYTSTSREGEVFSFSDRWESSESYLKWITSLISECHRVLTDVGAIMVHVDWRSTHLARLALDDIFGQRNFRNEIIWSYRKWSSGASSLIRSHQTIWYFAKSDAHIPNIPMRDYSPTTNIDQIWQKRTRSGGRVSVTEQSSGAKRGVPMGDVVDIPLLNPRAKERVGYPTQKPLALLELLVSIASNEGAIILDPCCGSGTSLVAAHRLNRKPIGIDISVDALLLAAKRLENPIKSESMVMKSGRESFSSSTDQFERIATKVGIHRVHRSKLIDGFLSPRGLSHLGLPEDISVGVHLSDGPPTADTVYKLKEVRETKGISLIIILTDSDYEGCTKIEPGVVLLTERCLLEGLLGCENLPPLLLAAWSGRSSD